MNKEEARQVMKERFARQRKEEIEKDLKEGHQYIVSVSTKFAGRFSHIEEKEGKFYAVFVQIGSAPRVGRDADRTPYRRIEIENIVDYVDLS